MNSIKILDCTFETNKSLRKRLNELRFEAEISIREGKKHLVLSDKAVDENKFSIERGLVMDHELSMPLVFLS